MSNTLYVKFLMRRLIEYLNEKNNEEADKLIHKIMKELNRG